MGSNYASVDWASEKHDMLVADETGEPILAATFAHDERGLTALCKALVRLKVQLVAIERPDGLLIERLLDAGLRVMAIHPNQVAAARPRFRTSGGKSDRFDAFVLCELARTDSHRFRVLVPDGDQTKALRALTRAREDLVQTRVALANQLRTALERFWPGAAVIFNDIDSPISLAFIKRYPSPNDAHGLGAQRLGWFLARHAYSGGKQPAQLIRKLRSAPEGRAGGQEIEARRAIVLTLVAAIDPLVAKISELTSKIGLFRVFCGFHGVRWGLTLRDPGLLLGGGGVRRRNTTGQRRGEDGWAIPEPGLRVIGSGHPKRVRRPAGESRRGSSAYQGAASVPLGLWGVRTPPGDCGQPAGGGVRGGVARRQNLADGILSCASSEKPGR